LYSEVKDGFLVFVLEKRKQDNRFLLLDTLRYISDVDSYPHSRLVVTTK